jgi:hypothetical protein
MSTAISADQRLLSLLPTWYDLLQQWSLDGRLSAAAREALLLSGESEQLTTLTDQWAEGDFSGLPPIVLLPATSMPGAAGAYAISTGTIYINQDWLQRASSDAAMAVLTEELGHHLDELLNVTDTPGDEGRFFSELLLLSQKPARSQALGANSISSGSILVNDDTLIWGEFSSIGANSEVSITGTSNLTNNVNEGEELTIYVHNGRLPVSLNRGDGDTLFWSIRGSGITPDDLIVSVNSGPGLVGRLSGELSLIYADGFLGSRGNFQILAKADGLTEGNETARVDFFTDSSRSDSSMVASTAITIWDTSVSPDTLAHDPSTKSFLSVNGSVNSLFETNSDIDWHKVILQAGRAYQVNGTLSSPLRHDDFDFSPANISLFVYDSAGKPVQSFTYKILSPGQDAIRWAHGDEGQDQIFIWPTKSQTLYIESYRRGMSGGGAYYNLDLLDITVSDNGQAGFRIEASGAIGSKARLFVVADDPDGYYQPGIFQVGYGYWEIQQENGAWEEIRRFQVNNNDGLYANLPEETGELQSITIDRFMEGKQLRFRFSYIDGLMYETESIESFQVPYFNDGAASFSITGTPAVGQTLTAALISSDPDGNGTFSYTWQASANNGSSWSTIGTAQTLAVVKSQEGHQIRLLVSYTDAQGFNESVTAPAVSIPFINDGAASFSITGTAAVGQTLTAVLGSSDPDGDGTFSYLWEASTDSNTWNLIGTAKTLTVTKAQEGHRIRLLVSYTDGQGFAESVTTDSISIPLTLAPTLSIAPLSADNPEGNADTTNFTFRVTRSGDLSAESSARWTVAGSGDNPADASDFLNGRFPSGTVRFLAGQRARNITVRVAGDTTFEPDEAFSVTLSRVTGASLNPDLSSAIGTIRNDDAPPLPELAIAATDANKPEGFSGNTPFTFTVTRTGDTTVASSASWEVSGIGASPADAADFSRGVLPSGTVRFRPGDTSRTITVNVRADRDQEPDERFRVTLSNPTGATITTASATGIIRNDDLIGTAANDTIIGTRRPEFIDGLAGQDTLTGGAGPDVFGFRIGQSRIRTPDRITDFRFGEDTIALLNAQGQLRPAPVAFSRAANNSTADTLADLAAAVFTDADGRTAGNQPLAANAAALVRSTNAAIAGTYLLINDANAGRSLTADLMVNITGFSGTLPALGVRPVESVFA